MQKILKNQTKLILDDGSIFYGQSFGSKKSTAGEVVFNTGMVGYPESLTDPSYKGQILVLTFPLIGNYGVPDDSEEDFLKKFFESDKIHITGLIVSDYCEKYNHWNAVKSLGKWMEENDIPGIYNVDTRELTKKLREKGVMLGKIIKDKNIRLYDPNQENLVKKVSTKSIKVYGGGGNKTKIVLVDCGAKGNIIRCLIKRNVTVISVPWDFDFNTIKCDGILISNGPGDPKMCKETISNLRKAIRRKIPIFGICLGNQLLALAAGANTYKLKYGHRSQNQPCIEASSKKCFITSQNHGFAVDKNSLPKFWEEWFYNGNDTTNEGIRHKSGLFSSVQFHPEATAGPVDTEFLFDIFIEKIKKWRQIKRSKKL